MKFKMRQSSGVTILDISGKLMGGADADHFRDMIHCLIEDGETKVIVNLADVKWVNSTGVGILITGYTTLRKNKGDLKLLNVSNKIRSVLYVTKLNLIFECYDNENEAVNSFS
ncbi:MAG: STAS domain-containing protein [Candidatus Krumholzibacteriota bacterium]|nr:STAS domain-containing protein [Candidatus Krumholzibacteriota bacterium]